MAYVKNTWVDQDVERPKTYEVTNNQDGSITLTDSFGLVTELGTPVNEVNMNHIEDGIDGCAIRKHNLTETFNLGEWVLGGTGDDEGIYKSLIDNNVGNAISDDTKWEKVEFANGKADIDLANVNDNGTSRGAGWALPSTTAEDLILGASGTTYTAPANGWVSIMRVSTSTNNWLSIGYTGWGVINSISTTNNNVACMAPVTKGQTFGIYYANVTTNASSYFKFYYAVGSESEYTP